MARIRKDDHARILQLVDVERRAVREIASEYGCTPAAIYNLLAKLRREAAAPAAAEGAEIHQPLALEAQPQAGIVNAPPAAPVAVASAISAPPMVASATEAKADRVVVNFERVPEPPLPPARQVGASLAKPGMGLLMRTPDGEETMTPFRSVDDLLSAIKPILRASARSPEPVWFSLQPVDLAAVDIDAA